MSLPALRKPKNISITINNELANPKKLLPSEFEYVIVTLDDDRKLVVTSDSYNGIISEGNMFNCVFCDVQMERSTVSKDIHTKSAEHRKSMEMFPHVKDFSENLVRMISKDTSYCTICNIITSNSHLMSHISTIRHMDELQRAVLRADNYKPCE